MSFRQRFWQIAWCGTAVLQGMVVAAGTLPTEPVNSFENAADLGRLHAHGATLRTTGEHVTHGKAALDVQFESIDWPAVSMAAPSTWDWSGFDGLGLDVTNAGQEAVTFSVRVEDDHETDGTPHRRSASGTIETGVTATFVLHLGMDPMEFGMRGLPVQPGVRCLGMRTHSPIRRDHIVEFRIFMNRPAAGCSLIIDNIRPMNWMVPLDGIVDEFGQYAKADWPGKLTDSRQFAERKQAEQSTLRQDPGPAGRDRFGGWTAGPQLRATGYFRTEKINDRWWLVTPDGHVFWSAGMDCVDTYNQTIITGREHMFRWLPKKNDPLAGHFDHIAQTHSGPVKEGTTFNFFTANLQRKYGPDYKREWLGISAARLKAWGFNTVGNWSDQAFYGSGRIPYVATVLIRGDYARVSSGSDWWGPMHDPYDARFPESAAKAIHSVSALVKDDPWCIGYFVDNELSWGDGKDEAKYYGLARGALNAERSSPAKQAFVTQLKAKYATIAKLNEAWVTQFADWQAMQEPWTAPSNLSDGMRSDFSAFLKDFAAQYFRVVRDALREQDQHHLYLGCRFAWYTPEQVAAADEFCDVVSFNMYKRNLDVNEYSVLKAITKPCIIGEFHFGALDRGMFHTGLQAAENQQERSSLYQEFVGSVLDHPAFVGCHWFQYVDQPLTGRSYDGENYNIGFVSVTDTPHPEIVQSARTIHGQMYQRRWTHSPQTTRPGSQ